MATADEIRARIAAERSSIHAIEQQMAEAQQEEQSALERQRLRRELDALRRDKRNKQELRDFKYGYNRRIDEDLAGPNRPDSDSTKVVDKHLQEGAECNKFNEEIVHTSIVAKAEYVWAISEMSWLVEALEFEEFSCLHSETVQVGGSTFSFQYDPRGGEEGTLSIYHIDSPCGLILRYRIFVKHRGGEFVQWGQMRSVCKVDVTIEEFALGPDVPGDGAARPQGIFGLSHAALSKSEWVVDDTLTVRFELEVRVPKGIDRAKESVGIKIDVPSPTIASDFAALLDSGSNSDVTIIVNGERLKVHSFVLHARSEVFDRLLNGCMRESVSREIVIDDCDACTFKAVLRFLYTDSFACVEDVFKATSDGKRPNQDRIAWLQDVLAVSHKYALGRLQAWCEHKLCECISIEGVCSVLCQAHLFESKQLGQACLQFMKANYAAVVVTEGFGVLARERPEVMLRINTYMAGVAEAKAKPAFEAFQGVSTKRKRED